MSSRCISSRPGAWFSSRLMLCGAAAALTIATTPVFADGFPIDKVYDPYVQPLEREIELRTLIVNDDDAALDGAQRYRLGLGKSFTDRIFVEFYLIGAKGADLDGLEQNGYELELKWQLTEQGEYFADWGLLFELETGRDTDIWEYSTAVLIEKEFGRWDGKLNLAAIYEWGDDIKNEWESELAAQLLYRYSPFFEPALELYSGQNAKGLGPVAVGTVPFTKGRKLLWELGVIFGLESDSPDQTYRAMLEYEF